MLTSMLVTIISLNCDWSSLMLMIPIKLLIENDYGPERESPALTSPEVHKDVAVQWLLCPEKSRRAREDYDVRVASLSLPLSTDLAVRLLNGVLVVLRNCEQSKYY